jgi:asparagine synthase (glutamine-hydrolysing)
MQRYDISNYIAYDNLPKVDTASMCHGLEVRVPLLDHVFLQTVAQIPPELKLHSQHPSGSKGGRIAQGAPVIGKYLLKKNGERFFSHEFLHRNKRGFEVPVQDWFCGAGGDDLRDRLTGPESPLLEFFQQSPLEQICQNASHDRLCAWRGWTLLILQEWMQQTRQPLLATARHFAAPVFESVSE